MSVHLVVQRWTGAIRVVVMSVLAWGCQPSPAHAPSGSERVLASFSREFFEEHRIAVGVTEDAAPLERGGVRLRLSVRAYLVHGDWVKVDGERHADGDLRGAEVGSLRKGQRVVSCVKVGDKADRLPAMSMMTLLPNGLSVCPEDEEEVRGRVRSVLGPFIGALAERATDKRLGGLVRAMANLKDLYGTRLLCGQMAGEAAYPVARPFVLKFAVAGLANTSDSTECRLEYDKILHDFLLSEEARSEARMKSLEELCETVDATDGLKIRVRVEDRVGAVVQVLTSELKKDLVEDERKSKSAGLTRARALLEKLQKSK